MKNSKLVPLLTPICLLLSASATIRHETSPLMLTESLGMQSQVGIEKPARIKTPRALCEEMCHRLDGTNVKVGNIGNHYLLKLDEIRLARESDALQAQLLSGASNNVFDDFAKISKKLRLARAVRQNLNSGLEQVRENAREKKRPRHQRDIKGSLFAEPVKPNIPTDEALFFLDLEHRLRLEKAARIPLALRPTLFESPLRQMLPSRHRRIIANHTG